MIEQMNLFGERDPFDELCDHIVKWYVDNKVWNQKHGYRLTNFDTWLLDNFSSYRGGNGDSLLFGQWTFYDFSPKGLRLTNMKKLIPRADGQGTEWESIFFPKQKILRRFGIKDNGKEALKEVDDD